MSDPEGAVPTRREWRFYIEDILEFAQSVLAYTEGYDQLRFGQSQLNDDATLRKPELIGKAAIHVPQHVRERAPRIPWRQIIATRNRLIHGYLGIDNDILWSIIRDDIPSLLTSLQALSSAAVNDRID